MDLLATEDVRKKCKDVLMAVGASKDQCDFYADALHCEHETLHVTYRLLGELRNFGDHATIDDKKLVDLILRMYKNFNRWRSELESLAARGAGVKPLSIDLRRSKDSRLLTATCSLQTNEMNWDQGDELIVTDASKPNQLKVRNTRGEEGYIPSLSCILPSPDVNAVTTVERLKIQLLACWTDCERKIKPLVHQVINTSAAQLVKQWNSTSSNDRFGRSSYDRDNNWTDKVSRRVRRLVEEVRGDKDGVDLNRLRKTFCSLENELIRQNSPKLSPLIETVASLDKAVLSYQAFRKHWRQYTENFQNSLRPIRVITEWDSKLFADPSKYLRCSPQVYVIIGSPPSINMDLACLDMRRN